MSSATRLKRGDTAPIFSAVLRDAEGDAVDLQAGDLPTLYMRSADTSHLPKIVAGAMTIVSPGAVATDPDRGRVQYAWQVADTDTPAQYDLEVRLTVLATGGIESFPGAGPHRVVIDDSQA